MPDKLLVINLMGAVYIIKKIVDQGANRGLALLASIYLFRQSKQLVDIFNIINNNPD